ncbi:AlpA family phage regulatory protein [Janthinobacterium sp.]|uniref:helix-turn-helix transcriptional regulator n=1 Tax=Janthinobacterium sp. TaxID=1871054 RepID=UPI002589704A|nr:AlpA family phage regulatory protein [Janthinobacterium sp.]MCX7291905.1 AlpA family phage regulatory protein [Janthinobacterium sp.]
MKTVKHREIYKAPQKNADKVDDRLLVTPALDSLPEAFQELINTARNSPNRAVRKEKETAESSGIARSTLWRDVKAGVFPPPIKVSARSVAWISEEVNAILAAKALNTRSRQKVDIKKFVSLLTAI